jgi:Na+-transporting NADH:ubiquinone oxidoreductase subunit B
MDMKEGVVPEVLDLLTGFRIGSLGESAIILILIASIYLIATKTANWKIMFSTLLSFAAVTVGLWIAGVSPAGGAMPFPPIESLFSGSILYVTVFMVTDPVSAPKKAGSQWIYGLLIGGVSAAIRVFSLFPEGVSFGVLLGNTFASLMDEWFPGEGRTKKGKAVSATEKRALKPALSAVTTSENKS